MLYACSTPINTTTTSNTVAIQLASFKNPSQNTVLIHKLPMSGKVPSNPQAYFTGASLAK